MLKVCGRCGVEKISTAEFFVVHHGCRGGLSGTCKECRTMQGREYKRLHSERISAARRDKYQRDGGRSVKDRENRRAHRDPWRAKAQRMRKGMVARALELGIPMDINFFSVPVLTIWIANNRNCQSCGVEFVFSSKDRNRTHSVARFVPILGYVRGNVAIICWRCNNLKRDATADELQTVVNWMRRFSSYNQAGAA